MAATARSFTWRRTGVALLLAAAVGSVMLPSAVTAQDVPGSNTGPRFAEWGPGHAAPGNVPQVAPPHAGSLGAPAPGAPAPAPGVPSPAWGGCTYNLAGSWAASGEETTPTAFLYDGSVAVVQYGNWLQATETQSAGQT